MKTLDWVLENFNSLETPLEDRLGKRLCGFLTVDQMKKIGWEYTGEEPKEVIPWTEENVLEQLKDDLEFGVEKATSHRGISASLMWAVCLGWCTILENGLDVEYNEDNYGYYGDKLFKAIDEKYNFGLVTEDTFNKKFYEEW